MSLYDRAQEGMTKIEGAITGLPVVKDYRAKEMRRDADRRLRERISQELENYRRKLSALQLDMVSSGNLRVLPEMERAVGRLQLLIDRIRTAAYGYAPFFDIEEIREVRAELAREAHYDLHRICERIRQEERQYPQRLTNAPSDSAPET